MDELLLNFTNPENDWLPPLDSPDRAIGSPGNKFSRLQTFSGEQKQCSDAYVIIKSLIHHGWDYI